ncbi:uncharacterized protein BP5553_04196 [Venustampulla echinocandica]|uniref:AA9 family lytic polysaccharide monooxygenase n=1 Tax=Venustampulla echinocandica TaxID=2656787 RepID=A0A370TWF3_9HELO|nr:uncharacterized protein BP5553_04196 [Venustampulla echinocandica]RDL39856.1 hypothetical protein BP5553_04196 [Venustampulla echinocandica]
MRISTLTVALAALQTVAAHTVFTTLFVDGVDQGDGTCVRMPMTPSNATDPVNDLASSDMACGFDGTKGVARVCSTNRAAKLNFVFREYADASQPGALDPIHKGPCAVYMKNVKSAINDPATGDGWFKIWDEGYDQTTSQWCTEKLMQNNGVLSAQIPDNLAGGYYLVRPELLALHQSDKNPPNPQFYLGCAQIFINSTATALPKDTVKIPGYTNISDPAVLFNIYTLNLPYHTPGPGAYKSGVSATVDTKPVEQQTEGLLPSNVVLTNANWWAAELNSYSDQAGCSNASETCYGKAKSCYDSSPPTGSKNCRIWEQKCKDIQTACQGNQLNGPPNKGKILTPPQQSGVELPSPSAASASPPYASVSAGSPASSAASAPSPYASVAAANPASPSSSVSAPNSSSLQVSQDGQCGKDLGQACKGSKFGDCCSDKGWCGSSDAYCSAGCQAEFGVCGQSQPTGLRRRDMRLAKRVRIYRPYDDSPEGS